MVLDPKEGTLERHDPFSLVYNTQFFNNLIKSVKLPASWMVKDYFEYISVILILTPYHWEFPGLVLGS